MNKKIWMSTVLFVSSSVYAQTYVLHADSAIDVVSGKLISPATVVVEDNKNYLSRKSQIVKPIQRAQR